ncbi:hypothetical protein VaNZ11_009198 [Volvox africanus]|uniref:Uncharacterized protein n=1 Tax=Volvox africanus TaxID=51714 RepID=A0ABQ5S6T3_9CHLO|nr:hypothetical protein VaNZ11_009198 [Volvox africanus]
MSEDPAVRAPIRRIKIKFGNKLVSTHDVRVTGLVSSASQDRKDAKQGSSLQLAKLRQASLQGYVPPSASADLIVARLREGEGFAPGSEHPPWDFKAPPIPCHVDRPSKRSRPLPSCAEDICRLGQTGPASSAATAAGPICREGLTAQIEGMSTEVGAKTEITSEPPAIIIAVRSGESNSDQATTSQVYLPLSPDGTGDHTARAWPAAPASGPLQTWASSVGQSSLATTVEAEAHRHPQRKRSNSTSKPPTTSVDVAVAVAETSAFAGSDIPVKLVASSAVLHSAGTVAAVEAQAQPPPRTGSSTHACGSCSPSPGSTARGNVPSTSGRHPTSPVPVRGPKPSSGISVDTQTQHGDFPLLPLSFLEHPRLCGTALSFQSIGPFDLQLEREERVILADDQINDLMARAVRVKHEGDKLSLVPNSTQRLWTMEALSKYMTSSLLFMEAADAMAQRREHKYNPRGAAELYRGTAEMLYTSVSIAENLRGNSLAKEGIRLLADRLCAICSLRHTSLSSNNFKACADRVQAALRAQQQQQTSQGAGAAAASTRNVCPQPCTEDSSTSSLQVPHVGGTNSSRTAGQGSASGAGSSAPAQPLAGFNHEQVTELVGYAHSTCRFAECMKRSCKSFEAFLERPDVRQDQQAKLVCMHLAAICMDVGMTPGHRLLRHAKAALRTLVRDLAR